jgi:hypothetical protein
MPAVPKGVYPPRDAAWLDRPGLKSDRCVVCGSAASNNHHEPPRSRFHKSDEPRIPTFSLCGGGNASGCHGLAHNNGGSLVIKPSATGAWYAYVLGDFAVRSVNARRRRNGRRQIQERVEFLLGEVVHDG